MKKKTDKPIADQTTINLVNKVRTVLDNIRESGGRYLTLGEIQDMEDAYDKCVEHNHLTKKGGISEHGHNEGKYEQRWYDDWVCHTDKNAYNPKKDKCNV